jgi:hypothetical protein
MEYKMKIQNRMESLAEFNSADDSTLFNQTVIAHVLDCSTATMERDRWSGGGIPYIKINRLVRYRKADVLEWLGQFCTQNSTSFQGV